MSVSKAKILILEDDASLGASLRSALEKDGFEVYHALKPDEALAQIRSHLFSLVFVDCLLPQMTGVDFVEKTKRELLSFNSPVVLMSGIYTDKQFVKEAIQKTQAVEFLKKPFGINDIKEIVKKYVAQQSNEKPSHRKELFSLFNRAKVTNRDKRKAIEGLEEVHGYDLPFIYSLLIESKTSGYLNIINEKGEVSGISFSNGSIVSVDIQDKDTYIGKLLIDKGYLTSDDLKNILHDITPRKLGQKLVENNYLSPHALEECMEEQMNIRLSRTIVDQNLKINFVSSDVEPTGVEINSETILGFLHDWIASKINFDWLSAHFMQWSDYAIQRSPNFSDEHPALYMPLTMSLDGISEELSRGYTINHIANSARYSEDAFYKALYFLFCKGLFIFTGKVSHESSAERIKTLTKLRDQFKSKNLLEVYEIMGGRKKEVNEEIAAQVYGDFLKFLGARPDPSQKDLSAIYDEIMKISDAVFKLVANAKERDRYEQELAKKDFDKKVKAQSDFEEAKNLITKSQPHKAIELFRSAIASDPTLQQAKLYMILAKLKLIEAGGDKRQIISDLDFELMQVPAEDKYNALYHYCCGLYYKAKGDYTSAKKSFEKCLAVEPNNISARRELSVINEKLGLNKQDFMNRDLKDMVAGFFKKK